jgi:hypothetical protein
MPSSCVPCPLSMPTFGAIFEPSDCPTLDRYERRTAATANPALEAAKSSVVADANQVADRIPRKACPGWGRHLIHSEGTTNPVRVRASPISATKVHDTTQTYTQRGARPGSGVPYINRNAASIRCPIMRTSVALGERAHDALRLLQSITGRTFSDIVNELLLAEIERFQETVSLA